MRARAEITALLLTGLVASSLPAAPTALRGDITVRHILDTGGGGNSIRIARDPTDGFLYYLRQSGSIYRLTVEDGSGSTSQRIYQGSDTGISSATGFAFGPDGTVYIVGNQATGNTNVATIRAGVRSSPGADARVWATVARTESYPRSNTAFDHNWNGITVSPDGGHIFVAAGSRTDHGEVQAAGGAFPDVREVALTARIFRIPSSTRDLLLENDEDAIRDYVFVRGVRNSFDPAFSPSGELFAGENSGDRDDSEELNWLREGRHYGFPWRMGGLDTPQQFSGYDPEADRLVDHDFYAYQRGFFHDDPSYPPPPDSLEFTEPCLNFGPDADSYRDPATGEVLDRGAGAAPLATFTAHRSPLGLVFDREGALGGDLEGDAFILGWTRGDPSGSTVNGPFEDPGQDLLHLEIDLPGDEYHVTTTRIVQGFTNPIDAEIVENRIYVLDHGGSGAIWEVTLPRESGPPALRRGFVNADAQGDISDGVAILLALFSGQPVACLDAADVDDSGSVDITDAVSWLEFLFQEGVAPPEPHAACGPDTTLDGEGDLGCETSAACEA
jgi:glucose/arabinose dehydrogenase